MSYKEISIEDYQYDLPPERIAEFPLENRDESKLLVFRRNQIQHARFNKLHTLLPKNSLIIWNNTKVIPARLVFQKSTGALIEIFLLEPVKPSDYASMFNQTGQCTWNVIIGNQKKWKGENLTLTAETHLGPARLVAEFPKENGSDFIKFMWSPANLTFTQILDTFGKTPIPPYLRRDADDRDRTRYQTVYANLNGSVAAPTAGLHFTNELIEKLAHLNIKPLSITLHVGSGTFIPVKAKTIGDHTMHAETVIIGRSVIEDLLRISPEKLTVVGTTTLRSLESLFWLGQKIFLTPDPDPGCLCIDQWEPYNDHITIDIQHSLKTILNYLDKWGSDQIHFTTRLLIVPGYQFKMVKRLITNFHQPSSTLLLLVSAFTGNHWKEIYRSALSNDYRFLSYGDSSLLEIETLEHA